MNSDPWRDPLQELWQRQPVPAPVRDEDRVLRDVRTAEEEEEREWSSNERTFMLMALLIGAPNLLTLAFASTFDWLDLWGNVLFWSWAAVFLVFRWRRRRVDRAFQHALLERIERGRRVLRERMIYNDVSMLTLLPVMSSVGGLLLQHITHGAIVVAALGGSATFAVLAWIFVVQRKKQLTQFKRRLVVLDDMRAQLAVASPADQP
jgi:O-antigen/teichoic acid export membrane protein